MKILVIHGPNLNMLGKRNKKHYGTKTLSEINTMLINLAEKEGITLVITQSNREGALIDFIQKNSCDADGILINPAALTHYGYSLRDALLDSKLPIVEVHLSDVDNREDFRKHNVLHGIVVKKISGLKDQSYIKGLKLIISHLKKL